MIAPCLPAVRGVAGDLYAAIRDLPIVSPHGHCDPAWWAEDAAFPDPAALLITPDHYLLRMLYSLGVPMEDLGVGKPVAARDSRAIFRIFAAHWDAFLGTPTRMWMEHTLYDVIGVDRELSRPTRQILYMIRSRSGSPIPRTGPARCSTVSASRFWRRPIPRCRTCPGTMTSRPPAGRGG
jgi:glucuronate isomerase